MAVVSRECGACLSTVCYGMRSLACDRWSLHVVWFTFGHACCMSVQLIPKPWHLNVMQRDTYHSCSEQGLLVVTCDGLW